MSLQQGRKARELSVIQLYQRDQCTALACKPLYSYKNAISADWQEVLYSYKNAISVDWQEALYSYKNAISAGLASETLYSYRNAISAGLANKALTVILTRSVSKHVRVKLYAVISTRSVQNILE